jgi:hypothetical protein
MPYPLNAMTSDVHKPSHTKNGYTSIQPSHGSSKASPIKEGLICAGIWALLSVVFASGIQLWGHYAYPGKSNISLAEWA